MSKKKFFVLGLFLVTGFLFFNVSGAQAVTWTWDGGGDTHTWTDPLNWDMNDGGGASANNYPGATSTVDVLIANKARVIATTTLTGSIGSLTLGDSDEGVVLTVARGATIYASTTVALLSSSTLAFGDNSANTAGGAALGLGAGHLYLGGYSGVTSTPLTIGGVATFTAGTSTITYAGTGGFYIATTTYYNLTLTPTSTAATRVYTIGNGGNATSTNVLTINQAAQLNLNARQLALSGSGTPLVYASDGDFAANNSIIIYSSTSNTNIATGTYATLTINGASATKSLVGNTTAVTAVNVNAGTLAVGNYTFTVSNSTFTVASGAILTIGASGVVTAASATWDNNGTVTETSGGKITLAGVGVLSNSAGGSAVGSFGSADVYPTIHIEITDTTLNFDASSAVEPQTATVTSTSGITDAETVTLTETGVGTGIFQGSITFALSGSDVTGRIDYQGGGTVSYTWTDSQDTDDTETASATFTGTTPGGGSSSSSGSSAATTATTATTVTTATTATTATTDTTTTATPATTAAPVTTVSGPTLDSVQTKIAGVVAKMATLSASPTSSELADVQAQIAAILADIQAIQTTAASQGAALGYNFVRPLALGMRHSDVTNLQTALKTDSSIYPEGKVTGYFGPATLSAIKKFQEKYGIASPGKSGYGKVGPATRTKLNELFGAK